MIDKSLITNSSYIGLLFSLLDAEVDTILLKHIRETITSMLQALAAKDLKHWLGLCKQVLLASIVEDETPAPSQGQWEFDFHSVLSNYLLFMVLSK